MNLQKIMSVAKKYVEANVEPKDRELYKEALEALFGHEDNRKSWLNEPCPPPLDIVQPKKITRVELIDHRPCAAARQSSFGRVYSAHDVKDLVLSYQDDGRTLKVFVK